MDNKEKEVMEKIRLEYFSNQYKTTFDMSYSPKLVNKYKLSTMVISVNRCLTEQKPLKKKKINQYNLRRLHQLYININRYDFVHEWTVFNYDFLSAYLLCGEYKMSNLLYEFSIGAHDPNGELRFLLKQFETSSSILDQYPNNLSFELIYRLFPCLNQLPTLTYNLLEQCLIHCPLQLITNEQRQQCLTKFSISNIISLIIDSIYLFILTNNDKLYVFCHHYYGLLMVNHFDILYKKTEVNEKLLSCLCKYPYVCCLSSNSSMIVMNCQTNEMSMQISCKKLISFINAEIILIISSSNNSLELWDCSKNLFISKYHFHDDIIEECTFKNSIIKVTLKEKSMISYFILDKDFQFNSIRIFNENINNYNHHILLDGYSEFYYSFNCSDTSLIIYDKDNNNSKKIINNINFISVPISVIYLSQSNSIAWLTSKSLMIFHPLYKENIFKPFQILSSQNLIQYDLVHDHYSAVEFENQTNFLTCINKTKKIIDIYEWHYDKEQQNHIYRQLTHVQLDISIDQCVFRANWFDGITMYCSDSNYIYKYNATMLTYRILSESFAPCQTVGQILNIHSDEFLTIKDNDNSLKIFTLNNNNVLDLKLSIDSITDYYFTKTSSHILFVDEKKFLSIYCLNSLKLLWTSKLFEYKNLQIHSFQSSFIVICLQTKEIFQIDINSLNLKNLVQLPIDCHLSTITSNNCLYIISNDPTTLIEFNLNNQNMTILQPIQLKSTNIIQLYSVSDYLIFHTDDNHIYLCWKEKKSITQLEQASRFISKDNRFVLVCTDNKTLILYDLKEKLRGTIRLDDNTGQCEAICLSNYNKEYEQYLFIICHDRFLRMYNVSNGKQIAKLFIHKDLFSFIGILNNRLLLKVDNHLCIIKIIDKKSLLNRLSNRKCTLFEQSMWMTCHHDHCVWSNTVTS
ncbi:unnamed protein product [Rotaria sp. Silwood2]|nr:unnamed protein product [Rotaria sp. Silwood2]CAF2977337.1 unnamed protein product [Rotaria sp. Silwood2]